MKSDSETCFAYTINGDKTCQEVINYVLNL